MIIQQESLSWKCVPKNGQSEHRGWGHFYGCWEYKDRKSCEKVFIKQEYWIGPIKAYDDVKICQWNRSEHTIVKNHKMEYWCVDSKGEMVLWNECKDIPKENCIPE